MSRSLRHAARSHKGRNGPQICPPPGPKLWALIEHAALGQPVYRVADRLPVPRLTWTAEASYYDLDPESVGIRADVASHLDAERDGTKRVEASLRSRVQLARLTAAAHRDIGGNRLVDIAEHFDCGGNQAQSSNEDRYFLANRGDRI